jgi:hypothetical protein
MNHMQLDDVSPVEQLMISLTAPPWCAIYLLPAGFVIFPILHRFFGKTAPVWGLAIVFSGVLLVLRFGTAIVRRFLPVSDNVRRGWYRNRVVAKRYDLYQWQKLFWVGFGIFVYAVGWGALGGAPMGLAAACVMVGGIAAAGWRRKRLAIEHHSSPK